MKKFSNMSGSKVGESPKIVENSIESNQVKYSIMSLMDNLLRVQSYGSARKSILATTKITGQELFIEALLDLISDKSFKDQIKALEALKSTNRDWESIDEKIITLSDEINIIKELQSKTSHISKIKNIIDVYGSDSDNFNFILESHCNKVKSSNLAYERSVTAKMMSENSKFKNYPVDKLLIISEKFLERANELKK